ncbi:MAG: cell division protein FtsQ/DivIB [Bifidobacterium mongoliense]
MGSSQAKGFVDPRELTSEDLVTKTLQETSGSLGMAARPKVVDFSARLRERRMARIRGWAVRVGVALLVLAVLGGLIWTLFFSPVLRLESDRIEVHGGNEWVSGQRIKEIAAKQSGRSLLLVSTSEVTAQLGDIPGVSAAKADKRYPRGMSVTITAQKPAAMLKASDDDLTAVDDRGRILNSVKGASASGIPMIEVGNVNDGLRDRAVLAALKILGDLPEQMRHRISKVSARTQDSITTELDDGRYAVLWGDASDLALKQAVVDKIVNDPTKIGDKHQVDVSAPLRPIIK